MDSPFPEDLKQRMGEELAAKMDSQLPEDLKQRMGEELAAKMSLSLKLIYQAFADYPYVQPPNATATATVDVAPHSFGRRRFGG